MHGLDRASKDSIGMCKVTEAQGLLSCTLEMLMQRKFYPMGLPILSKVLAKGVTFSSSLPSSFTQLLWKWPRASQIDW